MLTIKYQDKVVCPMRPEFDALSFGSSDVPHGTQSVIYKAAKVLNQDAAANIPLPMFSAEEVEAKVIARIAEFSFVDPEESPIPESLPHLQVVFANPSQEDVSKHLDELRGFNAQSIQMWLMKRDEEGNLVNEGKSEAEAIAALWAEKHPADMMGEAPTCPDMAAAEASLKAIFSRTTAEWQIRHMIDQCLIVPELSNAFMDMFELIEE